MTSCTIIISHYESKNFLDACIRQLRKYKHPEISQTIIVAEQSSLDTYYELVKEPNYLHEPDLEIVKIKPLYSGYGIDYLLRNDYITSEYICQIHADSFPISHNWLYLPIKLIEEYNLSFVGQLQFIAHGTESIYPPHPFFAMAQCFNVAKTSTYKEMSLEAGFTRFHNRKEAGLTFLNDDWERWAADDYANKGSDDDTVAFCWQDRHTVANKLGLAISGFIQPNFGRVIDDLVFHFGSARESIGVYMGEEYNNFTRRINENYSDELISEMVSLTKNNKPNGTEILSRNVWNGTLKKSFPPTDELNKRIEELKNN